jgi:methionyl-tRNA synthetase
MSTIQRTFYVTTPIYYLTAKPHLGSLYSTVLADVAARWHHVRGERTFLLTGTDEHGQKVAQAANAVGKTPQAFVDSLIEPFKIAWNKYYIDYTRFIRTTDPDHIRAVQDWVREVIKRGDIYKATYEGFYCTPCETFVLDRDKEHGAPNCPSCGRATSIIIEPCYFFKLSAYQDRLLAWYEQHPDLIVPKERINEVRSFVESGLKDLAISRSRTSVSWGVPFPDDVSQVVYVWADALTNYISAVGYGDPQRQQEFAQWWPAQLQVLGKDIVRFHLVFWPAFLMAAQLPLPERFLVHGWIKMGDSKMSKSLGNVIDPLVLHERYGADAVRYYLVRYLAITHDAPFAIEDLETRINADLADSLGNLVQRLSALACARDCATVYAPPSWSDKELKLYEQIADIMHDMVVAMESYLFHQAYGLVWRAIALINAYVHEQQPWKYTVEQKEMLERNLLTAAHAVATLSVVIWPVMPRKMEELLELLGLSFEGMRARVSSHGCGVPLEKEIKISFRKGNILFPKIENIVEKTIEKSKMDRKECVMSQAENITIDDFARIHLIVGSITEVAEVPKSDKLYRLTVDLGTELGVRTICSGVRLHFSPEDLKGKQGIFVANLVPRVMMGITSQGMMLFAEDENKSLRLVSPVNTVPNGTRLK